MQNKASFILCKKEDAPRDSTGKGPKQDKQKSGTGSIKNV